MEKSQASNLALGSLIFASVWALSSLGEGRIDVYVSIFALEYFVCLAIFRPRRRSFDFPAAMLFGAFALIVALRIVEILYG